MASVSLGKSPEETQANDPLWTLVSPGGELPSPGVVRVELPPPGSEDWEEVGLPPPPLDV